ncbi:hypothetical protein WICMUC_001834 [Wickerhamomyces mucosus]|uniref:Ras-GAP domain-containing protein n=1 Tax=Wickerhamomyces mucosus TaxID=1378264 RepID=A0A9P8PTD6_9ASCO|nr:hypothetical protein WICMUC_001834 [Wickerhamomyces mucosus]
MPPLFNSRSIRSEIEQNAGLFDGQIEWSTEGIEIFNKGQVKIGSLGDLVVIRPEELVLIHGLQECSIQVIDNKGTIFIESFKGREHVYLKCSERTTFVKLFSSLILWQGLKSRGILNKTIKKSHCPTLNTESNLLVASCKIFGLLPKGKNVETVQGPDITLFQTDPNERWFTAMVVLKSNGRFQLINESDGQLLYSIDVKKLTSDEVRELHNSIFESSNYLFLGIIKQLRTENISNNFFSHDEIFTISNELPKVKRIILEFPYRIDVDDWFVALKSFTMGEYVGIDNTNLLRVSRTVNLNILEVSELSIDDGSKLYVEVQLWHQPWYRTAIVESLERASFFRESFDIDLPATTSSFTIVLKKANSFNYSISDQVLGYSLIRYEDLTNKLFDERIPINSSNKTNANVYVLISKATNYILPAENFNNIEQMILNLDFSQLLNYVISKNNQQDLERTSVILLDIFQSLQRENDWFSALLDFEIGKVFSSSISINHSHRNGNNLYNSLFRSNSLLTKSLEVYNLRVGQEYLEKVVGEFIIDVITKDSQTEIDPMRISESDESKKSQIIDANYKTLSKYIEIAWDKIYKTSNDLPEQIKQQLKSLRNKIELFTTDTTITLNCVTGFIFLRFFCPVLLNPKLFFLTKAHQTGNNKRTLTLISKVLLTFANRSSFGAKEPYLIRFNKEFIEKHQSELLDYLDKVTMKKLDFTAKRLKLSSSLERSDILLTSKDSLKELPTLPFLIDKYLRIDQLVDMVSNERLNPEILDEFGTQNFDEKIIVNGNDSVEELYKIGSLEFEKLILDQENNSNKTDEDFEFGSEKFIKVLLKTNESEEIFNYINANSSLKDLITEADKLSAKKARLTAKLSTSETVNEIYDLDEYIKKILNNTVIDPQKNIFKISELSTSHRDLKPLCNDSTYNLLKFKFSNDEGIQSSTSTYAFNNRSNESLSKKEHKSPTKRIQRMIRSASLNTITSFTRSNTVTNLSSQLNSNNESTIDKGKKNLDRLEENLEVKKTKLGRWLHRNK